MELDAASAMTEIRKYEDALAKDPASFCFAPLAELYRKMGNLDDAIATAKHGCELHPDYVGGFMALGRAYLEKGMKAEGRAALERVVGITPDNLLAQRLLSQFSAEQGAGAVRPGPDPLSDDEMELEEVELIEELTDEDLIDEEEFTVSLDEADAPAEGADETEKKNPISTSTLAELYVSQGFLTHALKIYRELLDTDPDNADLAKRVGELERAVVEEEAAAEDEAAVAGAGAAMPESAGCQPDRVEMPVDVTGDRVIETLEKWLDTIRRRR